MFKIEATIRPFKLDEVLEALAEIGIEHFQLSEVKSYGRNMQKAEIFRGSEYVIDFVPKLRLECIIPAGLKNQALDLIQKAAKTGQPGDGTITCFSIETFVRIETGDINEKALDGNS